MSGLNADWGKQSKVPGYKLERLNALAFPKGQSPKCELTGRAATVQLVTPYLTLYFASREDAVMSWTGIMHKLCPLLGPLRSKPPIVGSEEERLRRQKTLEVSLRALVDLTKNEASKFLAQRKFKLAVPGALQSLKFAQEVFGPGHIELVPSYLLLTEANLGLKGLQQAEQFLSLANWSVLKTPDCSNSIRSQLHRNFGKLYALQGRTEQALKHMANNIYFSSLDLGPEHVDTAVGYYHMANIFFAQNRVEQGLAFFDKVVDIWYKFLANLRNRTEVDVLNSAQTSEAMAMLQKILLTRSQYLGEAHIATGEAMYTLGLLDLFMGANVKAHKNITKAVAIYKDQLGDDHPSTQDVRQVLWQLNEATLFAEAAEPAS